MEEIVVSYFIEKEKITFISNLGNIINILSSNPVFDKLKLLPESEDWKHIKDVEALNYNNQSINYSVGGIARIGDEIVDTQFKPGFEKIGKNNLMKQDYINYIKNTENVTYKPCINASVEIRSNRNKDNIVVSRENRTSYITVKDIYVGSIVKLLSSIPFIPKSIDLQDFIDTSFYKIVDLYESFWKKDFVTLMIQMDRFTSLSKNVNLQEKFIKCLIEKFNVSNDVDASDIVRCMTDPSVLMSYVFYKLIEPN